MSEDFKIYAPAHFYKAEDATPDKQLRIAGVISTETKDRQGEVVLQRGLDFSEFLDFGWFNDNHGQKTTDVLGYPEAVKYFEKGAKLPDQSIATSNCHWAEGYLVPDEQGRRIWEKGVALQKASGKRTLGFSIEGKVRKRAGADQKVIAQAAVRNVAITATPVNGDTKLAALVKSLQAAEAEIQLAAPDLSAQLQLLLGDPDEVTDTQLAWLLQGPDNDVVEVRATKKALSTTSGAALMPESLERKKREDEKRPTVRKPQSLLEKAARVMQLATKLTRND